MVPGHIEHHEAGSFQFFPSCYKPRVEQMGNVTRIELFQFFPSCYWGCGAGARTSPSRRRRGGLSILSQLLRQNSGTRPAMETGRALSILSQLLRGSVRVVHVEARTLPFNSFPVATRSPRPVDERFLNVHFQFFPSCYLRRHARKRAWKPPSFAPLSILSQLLQELQLLPLGEP